ncbi:hypothetical protein PHMEG_00012532 [Phytophthora megakarya]|uniref:Uncharacterized protein n=1 Tax=Phytophthora megakarya TaxID=4795 RepID=A0A225WA09_9STRA|nr:hypothetical protein PHMEG_00012532 [Phytophthora megakarya]
MNPATLYIVLLSLLVSTTSSAPEFGFDDIFDSFTQSRPTNSGAPKPSETKATISTPNQSSSNDFSGSTGATRFSIGFRTNATSTIESTYRNWVGPIVSKAPDTACYREAHIGRTCPLEFNSKWDTCWTQCPLTYPVKCGMECIRQNDDCKLEVVAKTVVLVQSAFALAIFNMYGQFKLLAKGVQRAIRCGKEMAIVVKGLTKYVRTIKAVDPQTTQAQLLEFLYTADKFVFDIPIAIAICMGITVKPNIRFADKITNTAELVLKEVVTNADSIFKSWTSFKAFMKRILLGEAISNLGKTEITSVVTAMKSNTTCGYDMKSLADRTWMTILALRKKNPQMTENELRVYMSKSNLVLNDIPIATNNCMVELIAESDEKTAYATRATLRKTFGIIVEDLIKTGTSDNGTYLNAEEYAFRVADKALTFYGVWDVKGITQIVSEYFQTICGPTKFIGDIDDGPANKALGLSTVGKAFNGSSGVWSKDGDGTVIINFKSNDVDDVSVNIHSAGDKIDTVKVSAGRAATWSSNVSALGDKTLYLDRWRPGFLGLPGTGGGSLLLWVPRPSQSGGHLELNVTLNVS